MTEVPQGGVQPVTAEELISLEEASAMLPDGWSVRALKHAIVCRALSHVKIGATILVSKRYLDAMLASDAVNGIVGNIYFAGFGKYLKIGFTKHDPRRRLRTLQTACPETLVVYGVIRGTTSDERALHQRFSRYRLRNEWFRHAGWLKRHVKLLPPSGSDVP